MRPSEIADRATQLGVPLPQLERDVMISHALHEFPSLGLDDGVVFFGGTALSRTHLPGLRLSEDIDLLSADPADTRRRLEQLPARLARTHPESHLTAWQTVGSTVVAVLEDAVGRRQIRVQIVPTDGSYRRYPTAPTAVDLRYPPLPESVVLLTPTTAGAAAMKLAAWSSRAASRDLVDLFGLAENGMIDAAAAAIAEDAGTVLVQRSFDLERVPSQRQWRTELGSQMANPPAPERALLTVRASVASACGWVEAEAYRYDLERHHREEPSQARQG